MTASNKNPCPRAPCARHVASDSDRISLAWAGPCRARLGKGSSETRYVSIPCSLTAPFQSQTSFLADCEVTISWGTQANESTCGVLSRQSDRWLGGALQLSAPAVLAEPLLACNRLDNPTEPNVGSGLPQEGYAWVSGPYGPPDTEGLRVRTVQCLGADGVVANDTFCIDPKVPDGSQWRPASSTASRTLAGKIALTRRGVCTFVSKGTHAFEAVGACQ